MRVAAVAHDPGGANAVAAVVAALRSADVTVDAHAKGPAVRRLAEMQVPCHGFDGDHRRVIAELDADILVAGTSATDCFELDAISAFATRGLPTLAVLDYPANYWERFRRGAWSSFVVPDVVTAIDEASATSMVSCGIPAERIRSVGQPYLGWLLRRERHPLRPPSFNRRILFASQPAAHELEALALVAAAVKGFGDGAALTIRFHPRQTDRKASLAYLAEVGVDAVVDDQTPTLACLQAHDVVLGITSTILIEGALLGRCTASVLAGELDDPLAALRPGLIPALRSVGEVRRFLEAPTLPLSTSPFAQAQRDADRRVAHLCRALAGASSERT
jgi:hypothetical protein